MIFSKLRKFLGWIIPPFLIEVAKLIRNSLRYKQVRQKSYPAVKGVSVVDCARKHLREVSSVTALPISPSIRWKIYFDKIRADIDKIISPQEAIFYAQSRIGFDHRGKAHDQFPYFPLYENTLKCEFPHFSYAIDKMSDSPYSLSDTICINKGHLISNIFFCHLRHVLQCLTYIKDPKIVCEIGGGYGSLARLWLQNPIHRPKAYVIIDFPESLFFAEVFLKINFDEINIIYINNQTTKVTLDTDKYSVILCPIGFVNALSSLSLDLVVNTGSMQEMTEEWVDFWMQWLDRQSCRYFYSINYFAQPLAYMAEGANTWSPRLSSDWVVRLQRFDPPFIKQQSSRNFAEILAEKPLARPSFDQQTLWLQFEAMQRKFLDGQLFLEAMDIIRISQNEEMMWCLLQRCMSEMYAIPKEAYYLAEQLSRNATPGFRMQKGKQLEEFYSKLRFTRMNGQENLI